jgi:polyribonucleotide nucleotidyltransferase
LRSTDDEILAGRAIDRALWPRFKPTCQNNVHVTCSVQAHDVWGTSGNPIALSLNSAFVVPLLIAGILKELVACVHVLCFLEDGTLIMDPSPAQVEDSLCELLFAGTATDIAMMECSSPTDQIKETMLVDLMRLAHSALEPILDIQRNMISVKEEQSSDRIIRDTHLGCRLWMSRRNLM